MIVIAGNYQPCTKHAMRKKGNRNQSTSYHPSKKTDISMSLILTPFRRIDLDHIELAIFPVPVENTLHSCPPTPLNAPLDSRRVRCLPPTRTPLPPLSLPSRSPRPNPSSASTSPSSAFSARRAFP